MTESFPNEHVGVLETGCHTDGSGFQPNRAISPHQTLYLLKHIERAECITISEDNVNWLVAFSSSADAFEMRHALGVTERVDIIEIAAGNTNYTTFLLDGEPAVLQDRTTRPQ